MKLTGLLWADTTSDEALEALMTTVERETFVRPNGKPYRPRTEGLSTVTWYNDWQPHEYGVIVFGTHDRSKALDMAIEAARAEWGGSYSVDAGQPGWVRDGIRDGERIWLHDDVRGRPCVEFMAGEL